MGKIKPLSMLVLLLCQGCASVGYNYCGEGIPPEKADADIKRLFQGCSPSTGVSLGDKSRFYYAVYAEGRDAEESARRNVAEKIRKDVVGSRYINIPLYDLELFKHFL